MNVWYTISSMKSISRQVIIVNIFGASGYMLLCAAWAFFIAIAVALLIDPSIQALPTDITQNPTNQNTDNSSPALIVAGYVIAALMAAVSVVVIVTLPYLIGKWGSKILRSLMKVLRIPYSQRQLFLTKSVLAVVPLIGLLIINGVFAPETITFAAVYVATVVVATLAIIVFFLQLLLARSLGVSADKTW